MKKNRILRLVNKLFYIMMKRLLLVAFALCSSMLFSQTTITGTVNDATLGGPLPGANIKVSRKAVGTSTDFDGKFKILYGCTAKKTSLNLSFFEQYNVLIYLFF